MAGIYWLMFLSCTEIVYAAFLNGGNVYTVHHIFLLALTIPVSI